MKAKEFVFEAAPAQRPTLDQLKKQKSDLEDMASNLTWELKNRIPKTTKHIKYDDTHLDIINELDKLAQEYQIDASDWEDAKSEVIEAKNALESAIYKLENPFTYKLGSVEDRIYEVEEEIEYYEEGGIDAQESIDVDEAKKGRRAMRYNKKPRDPNHSTLTAKRTSGAGGAHKDKKAAEKRGEEKHKKDLKTSEAMLPHSVFAGSKVGQKEGPAGQLKGKMKRPARKGDLVGGGA